jgi:hypothetical protein
MFKIMEHRSQHGIFFLVRYLVCYLDVTPCISVAPKSRCRALSSQPTTITSSVSTRLMKQSKGLLLYVKSAGSIMAGASCRTRIAQKHGTGGFS